MTGVGNGGRGRFKSLRSQLQANLHEPLPNLALEDDLWDTTCKDRQNIKNKHLSHFYSKINSMNITGGIYRGQKIMAPDENITRPTLSKVRMSVFNTLQCLIDFEGSTFLDMYAGSGIMGLEALSRGFSKIVSIEKNKKVYNVIKANFKKYESDNHLKLILGDSIKICSNLSNSFDVIYIDPPYFSGIYEKSLEAVKNISGNIVIIEHVVDINVSGFEVIKQKKYSDKYITFLKTIK